MKRPSAFIGLIHSLILILAIGFGGASFVLADEPAASSPTVQEEKGPSANAGEVQERAVPRMRHGTGGMPSKTPPTTGGGTSARPNTTRDAHGCTAADLQSNAAGSCLNQNINDAINYPSQQHGVYCDGLGGKKCCTVNTETGQIITCRNIKRESPTQGSFQPPNTVAPSTR